LSEMSSNEEANERLLPECDAAPRDWEDPLSNREQLFREIAESAPAGVCVAGLDGCLIYMNDQLCRMLGYSAEELTGRPLASLIHCDDRELSQQTMAQLMKEPGSCIEAEARFMHRDGTIVQTCMRISLARHINGRKRNFVVHMHERTQCTGAGAAACGRAEESREIELSVTRAIMDETLEGILVVDDAGVVVSSNEGFLKIWGVGDLAASGRLPGNIVGVTSEALMAALLDQIEDPKAFKARVRELHRHPDEKEYGEFKFKDGRTVERRSAGLRSNDGRYLGRVWFQRDITAQKQAEADLRQARDLAKQANNRLFAEHMVVESERERLRALIDNIPDFVYVKDTECRFVIANAAVARLMGAEKAEDLLGKTDFDFYPREMAMGFYEDEQRILRSDEPCFNREERNVDGAGNEFHVLTTKVTLHDSEGRVIGIAGIGRDITIRKKMENALREAEQNYRGIFDKAIVGFFQSSPEGRFLSVNPAMALTFGYDSPEEMIAGITDISQQFFVNSKRRTEFRLVMDKVDGIKNFECEVFRKDGSKIWISMSVRASRQNGEVIRYEGMCEDITERTLLREQLLQAQKLESVGQLAAGIAHEINTPTQYIGDNVRFLKDAFEDLRKLLTNYERLLSAARSDALSGEMVREVGEILECTDAGYLLEEIPKAIDQTLEGVSRVAALVSAMKEFSHPSGKEKIPLDLNHAIGSTIAVSRNEWKYVAEMETDFDSSLPPVLCLAGEFNQVILNLIVNAAHAVGDVVKKGGPEKGKIKVQTMNRPEWAEIRIQDTGTGIPEQLRARIFDPFFTTKEIGKGTGQGLAIARSVIVDKHGGTIQFESEEGKGTTFIICLPRNGKALESKVVTV